MSEVSFIIVPKLDEMSIEKMIAMIQEGDEARRYFTDETFKRKKPDRAYFFNVLNTMYDGFIPSLL